MVTVHYTILPTCVPNRSAPRISATVHVAVPGLEKCEVLEQECIWIRAFDRLKPFDNETTMLERQVVFRDASLRHTSTWVNRFLGRDYFVKTNPADGSSGA